MKPTIGLVSQEGIIPVCRYCDAAGPMTTSVLDFANALQAIVDPEIKARLPAGGFAAAVTGDWEGIRVGALNPEEWRVQTFMCAKDADFEEQQVSNHSHGYIPHAELSRPLISTPRTQPSRQKASTSSTLYL